MINNLQNTNFQAKIIPSKKLYNAKALGDLIEQGKYVDSPWTLKESRFSPDECFTEGAITCTTGFLKAKGGKEFYMFHLDPHCGENLIWGQISRGLAEVQERLKADGKKVLEGFLLGASSSDEHSMEQAKNLIKFFKQTGVNFSALLGQKDQPLANLHYSLPKNEATITFDHCNELRKERDLNKSFSEVIIGDDEFEFQRE